MHSQLNFQTSFLALDFYTMAPTPISPVKVGHIDDVQELRKAKQSNVPQRFVRDMAERPELATTVTHPSDIPVIDLSNLVKGGKARFQAEILKLTAACEEWGFFQVFF